MIPGDGSPARSALRRPGLLLAVALTIVAACHLGALQGPFIYDDLLLIRENPLIQGQAPLSAHFAHSFWSTGLGMRSEGFYRPLVTLSFALDQHLWGGNPFGFHLTNLLLHLGSCALVFAWARRLGAGGLAAALAAGLFGTMPRLTESVSWIAGRTDVLAAFFIMAALLAHSSGPERAPRRIAAAALLLPALLAKETGAMAVLAIALIELVDARRAGRSVLRSLPRLLPVTAAVAIYLVLRSLPGSEVDARAVQPWTLRQIGLALESLGTYAVMLLDPLRPRLQIGFVGALHGWRITLGALLALIITAGGVLLWRSRAGGLGKATAVLVVAPLVPVLHLVPLPVNVVASDRYLYLPCAAIAALVASRWPAVAAPRLRPALQPLPGLAATLLLAAFASATVARNADWQDDLRLWNATVATAAPGNMLPRFWRATSLMRRDNPQAALEDFRRGLEEWRATYPTTPPPAFLLHPMAMCMDQAGFTDDAVQLLDRVVAAEPAVALYRRNLIRLHLSRLDFDAADQAGRAAVAASPDDLTTRALVEEVRRLRAEWTALPPEQAGDDAARRTRRALLSERLGRRAEAARLFATLIDAEGATAEQLDSATRFFIVSRDAEHARRALRRLRTLPGGEGPAATLAPALGPEQ